MTLAKVDVSKTGDAIKDALGHDEIEPLVITRKGKAVAVMLPLDDGDYESIALSLNPAFMALIERSRQSIKESGGISLEEIEREFGLSKD